uniref:Uncharacterized protein n=1 Tax=Pseudomonas phage HRDY3 TaxID=3236930 RepID=A0AB39CDK6_9VIRU
MLGKHISKLGIDPQSHDGKRLIEECILCLSGVNTAFDFQRNVKDIDLTPTGLSGKELRLGLLEKSYLTVNVKYAALFLSLVPNNADSYNKLQAYLTASDIALFRQYFSRRNFKAQVKANALGRGIVVQDVTHVAMRRDKKAFEGYLAKAMRHIRSRVRKKLTFAVKAENNSAQDYTSDLTIKVLRAYHSLIPTKQPEAYIVNYIRRSATNEANNMIDKHTTAKRGRMVKGKADGFGGNDWDLVCRSESQMGVNAEGESEYDTLMNKHEDHAPCVDSAIMLGRLMTKFKGRKRKILEILSGQIDEGFTRFLKRNNKLGRGVDHQDYQNRVPHQTFLKTLAQYLGVYQEAFMRFVHYIGGVLTAHKELA